MNTASLSARLSQQITATYARNHFKEVAEKALKEGVCIIVRKSTPSTVVLSMAEYEKLQAAYEKWEAHKNKLEVPAKKMTLEELKMLRKNSVFAKHAGTMKDSWPGLSSVEIAKKWTDYVD